MSYILIQRSGRAAPLPASGIFIPDNNYGYTGTGAFDSSFTLTNITNPFGATGPTLIMLDDFRGGTAGNQMTTNTAGLAGSSNWVVGSGGSAGQFGMPIYEATGRNPTAKSIRIFNNNGTFTPYAAWLSFAATQGMYIFWAENSNGSDYTTFINNGGSTNWNYKMTWFNHNNTTAGCFNAVMPVLVLATAGVAGFNLYLSSNDLSFLPQYFISGGGNYFDPNNWTSLETCWVGNASNPTGAAGILMAASYSPKNFSQTGHGRRIQTDTSDIAFNSATGANGTYASGNSLFFPGLIEGVPPANTQGVGPSGVQIDRTDAYVAVGFNCLNRIILGDQSTILNCQNIMICDVTSWSAGSITMNLRQGPFANYHNVHMFWSDAANTITHAGYFA